MKILVSGVAGFVASNIANDLFNKYDITGVDDLSFGNRANLRREVRFIEKDFNKLSDKVLSSFDVLIHCACANIIYAQTNQVKTFKINALDSIELFNRFKGKIIYTSTASVYGQSKELPTPETAPMNVSNAYDQSKLIAERFLEIRGNYTTLRLSNVYGVNQRPDNPYAGVIGKFIDSAIKSKPFNVYGDGSCTRDYTYISDVVNAVELAIEADPLNTSVNISGNCEASSLDLVREIKSLTNSTSNVNHTEVRQIDTIKRRLLDISKAKELLNWSPKIGLTEGLKKTIDYQY